MSPFTAAEEADYAARIAAGDLEARDRFITANVGLVYETARRVGRGRGDIEADDLIAEGMVGLVEAVDRFDPSKGRFSSVAIDQILMRMRKATVDQAGPVRLPLTRGARRAWWRVGRAHRELLAQGIEPTTEAVATYLEVKLEEVEWVLAHQQRRHLRLDATVRSGERPTEMAADADPESTFAEADAVDHDREQVVAALDVLDARLRLIIERRYLQDSPASSREIAAELGIGSRRVQQLEAEALAALRSAVDREGGDLQIRVPRAARMSRRTK